MLRKRIAAIVFAFAAVGTIVGGSAAGVAGASAAGPAHVFDGAAPAHVFDG